jgi:hypothetical protein
MVRSGHDQTGFKQFVDLAAGSGGHADHELASGRVRVSRRLGLGEAANLAVAQAVVDERENLAGHRYPGLVGAAPFGDAAKPGREGRSAVIAGHRLDQRPPHQAGALLGDRSAGRLGVGLAMLGVSPAHEHNASAERNRLMSPISATNTAAMVRPTPSMAWIAW